MMIIIWVPRPLGMVLGQGDLMIFKGPRRLVEQSDCGKVQRSSGG